MVSDSEFREILFGKYCPTCEHSDKPEEQIPCCYCLEEPLGSYSEKPSKYEEKRGIKNATSGSKVKSKS